MSSWYIPRQPKLRTGHDIETRVELGEPRFVRNWLSADLGQAADYSALIAGQTWVSIERTHQRGAYEMQQTLVLERGIQSYRVVNAHRPRLGTSYPAIAAQIDAFLEDLPDADLLVDGTGVGKGVIDILRSRNLRPIAITITGGIEVNRISQWDIRVPKTELVSALIAASQEDRLRIAPGLPLRDVLAQEIASFSPRQTATGHTTYEGRDGVHDDLVLGLAIGVWHQDQPRVQPARRVRVDFISR